MTRVRVDNEYGTVTDTIDDMYIITMDSGAEWVIYKKYVQEVIT